MIDILRDGTYDGSQATPEEIAMLDAELERVAPGVLRWKAPNPIPEPPMRGLGDLVKKVTDYVGIPQCGGCKQRQEWLNKKIPFNSSQS